MTSLSRGISSTVVLQPLLNDMAMILFISVVKNLEEDIFVYAKMNLAVVNVYIKDPVVTRIMRDQELN